MRLNPLSEKKQVQKGKLNPADSRVFVSALNNLESSLASALKAGMPYLARFSSGFEGNVDSVFRKILSTAPPGDISEELKSVRVLFQGFDTLSGSEKMEVLRTCADRISAVASHFHNTVSTKPGSRPKALSDSVDTVAGVGSSLSSFLAKKNVYTVWDALFYFPFRYEDRRNIMGVSSAVPNRWQTVSGRVEYAGRTRRGASAQFRVVLKEKDTTLDLVWFHFDERYMRNKYKKGKLVLVSGDIGEDSRRRNLQIVHPAADGVEVLDKADEAKNSPHINRIVPVYALTDGLSQRRLRGIMKNVAEHSSLLDGILPEGCAPGLISLPGAVKEMHFPVTMDRCSDFSQRAWEAGGRDRELPAPRTVAFFEFFLLRIAIEISKRNREKSGGLAFKPEGELSRRFLSELPFRLTGAQNEAFSLIRERMESPTSMNMLLQGDVGSGKTVVALQAMMKALDSGYQTVLMAPTQILAEQHAKFISPYAAALGVKMVMLKGGDSGASLEGVANGEAGIVVGTHALLYDRVKFKRLGLAVVDEQHKFGVAQREKLRAKGFFPDILVMTATPIPRSLAMTVYGDLEVALIGSLPRGRKKIETLLLGSSSRDREKMIKRMNAEIEAGRQCYIVCPLIDRESDNMEDTGDTKTGDIARVSETAQVLRKDIPGARVSVLHGRMVAEEKNSIMDAFSRGETDVLVSTTVVEVGIDVPNATLVAVENADRFGLSQLHQLRGRVGRGTGKSVCILLKSVGISSEGEQRLEILSKSSDGFSIAEKDLAMRGPGEFIGTKQSGIPDFHFADLVMDTGALSEARKSADKIVSNDPELKNYPELKKLALGILSRFSGGN